MLILPRLSLAFLLLLLPLSLCAEDYYKLLGIDRSASDKEIKRAYRTMSKKFHPDKNPGNESAHQKFVAVSEAYEYLSDETTRKIYDQYGHDGLERHKSSGGTSHQAHDPFDLFSRFFGGGGHSGHAGGQRRGPDMEVRLHLPLKDFYTGRETEFTIEKQHICEECEGSGSADGQVDTCQKCGGRGLLIQKHMLAPGIFQQVQTGCDMCGGQGKTIKHKCKVCGGSKVVKKPATLSILIEKGMSKGARITYENEADESPDFVAGDLHVYLMEQEPAIGASDEERTDGTFFRRKGTDLFWKEVLSLREAWMGDWTRNITHLDGHVVQLSRKRGEVVQPLAVEVVKGEGMPIHPAPQDHHEDDAGALFVEYTIILPDQMEQGMEKDFWAVWDKWRRKKGVDLGKDSGRPKASVRDEL